MNLEQPQQTAYFTFRPSRMRPAQNWSLSGHVLTGPNGDIDLSAVTEVSLVQLRGARLRMLRFRLGSGRPGPGVVRIVTSTSGRPDGNLHGFLALVSECATRLAVLSPGLTYRMEEGGPRRNGLFLLGLLGLLVGLGLTGYAFLTLYTDILRLLLCLPGLAALKFCSGALMYRFWPMRRPEEFPIGTLPFILWTMGGPRPTGLGENSPAPMS